MLRNIVAKTLGKFLLYIKFCLVPLMGEGNDSFRFTLDLSTPRRYAVRYNKNLSLLEIKILPAKSHEFEKTKFYDNNLINRVVVTEIDSEVILGFELKNRNAHWFVSEQNNPWRILVDVWNSKNSSSPEFVDKWEWQKPVGSDNQTSLNKGLPEDSLKSQEIDIVKSKELPKTQDLNHSHHDPKKIPNSSLLSDDKKVISDNRVIEIENKKKYTFPKDYDRLIPIINHPESVLQALESQVGKAIGTEQEWDALLEHVKVSFDMGRDVSVITRRMASLSETKFKENSNLIWISGENAYLNGKFELANEYFKALMLHHPNSPHTQAAILRITDIENISLKKADDLSTQTEHTYKKIALSELAPMYAKIAAALRINLKKIDKNVQNAKIFLPLIDECVNKSIVPIETRKNCFYVRTRFNIENMNIIDADSEVQKFMNFSQNDSRANYLNSLLSSSVIKFIENISSNKDWSSWVQFEKRARPGLLDFTLKDPKLLKFRALAFLENGNKKEASNLLTLYAMSETSVVEKIDAKILSAKNLYEINEKKRAEDILKDILSQKLKNDGIQFSNAAHLNLKILALAPFKSSAAFNLIMSEMKDNKYTEYNLNLLLDFIKISRKSNDQDWLYSKLIAFPTRNQGEIKTVEEESLKRADKLRNINRLEDSANLFLAISKLNGSEKRAEAAYKAGLIYARIGLLEKARESWQIAASDTNDKRYSLLASERLDRMK